MTRAVFIVPWRDKGSPVRRANLHAVLDHLNRAQLGDVVVVGDARDRGAPFNRSAAYNRGVAMHPPTPGLVYCFHEADMIVAPDQLRAAIQLADKAPGLVIPFDTYRYLSATDSASVHDGADPWACTPERVMADGRSTGPINVLSWETMQQVGRWDETFEGWGFDDRAMARAFQIATGTPTRFIPGPGYHLWHEPGWAAGGRFIGGSRTLSAFEQRATENNRRRLHDYLLAKTPQRIRELTAGMAVTSR